MAALRAGPPPTSVFTAPVSFTSEGEIVATRYSPLLYMQLLLYMLDTIGVNLLATVHSCTHSQLLFHSQVKVNRRSSLRSSIYFFFTLKETHFICWIQCIAVLIHSSCLIHRWRWNRRSSLKSSYIYKFFLSPWAKIHPTGVGYNSQPYSFTAHDSFTGEGGIVSARCGPGSHLGGGAGEIRRERWGGQFIYIFR